VEPKLHRRNLASKWCDHVYDVEEFFAVGHLKFDVVIEASGFVDNIRKVFRQIRAKGRVVLLARSGQSLQLDAIDHMITNAITVTGARGHLGGAFEKILKIYATKKFPLGEVITGQIDSIAALENLLATPDKIVDEHCKVLVKLNEHTL
jgi:threonine dehydrogenase-like Zn-dependent dehydrogenase